MILKLTTGLYPAYKVFLLSYATTLSLQNNRVLPLKMVIKHTKLYDTDVYV
jgi:hypothetical protein